MIRNLIFDVGNVLLGFRTMEMLQKHGMSPDRIQQMIEGVFSDPLWARLDLGSDPFSDVVELFCRNLPELRSDIHWLIQDSEQMKVDRPDVWERVHLLGKKSYKLYILSNYAEPFYNKQFRDAPFMAWMDGAVISYQVHLIKPDQAIYRYLLETYGLDPDECLFFDDLQPNIEAAEKLGFETFHVTSKETLIRKLDSLLAEQN